MLYGPRARDDNCERVMQPARALVIVAGQTHAPVQLKIIRCLLFSFFFFQGGVYAFFAAWKRLRHCCVDDLPLDVAIYATWTVSRDAGMYLYVCGEMCIGCVQALSEIDGDFINFM